MKQYFHNITDEEYKKLEESGTNWEKIMKNYSQPDWCSYPNALEGIMGCRALVYRDVKSKSFCEQCEFCDKVE